MPELVGEHTYTAVLRLDGIVANPEIGGADADTTEGMRTDTIGTVRTEVGIPAMAPNSIRTLGAATGLFAFTCMDGLEVIDVPIGLIEVTIAISVIAIPDVEWR